MPILSEKLVTSLQSMQTILFSFIMSLSQAIRASASCTLLSLLLNSCIFFNLSDIINYIHNYLIGLKRVEFYCNVVEQTAIIFKITSFFASNLLKVVKKDKSWQNKE